MCSKTWSRAAILMMIGVVAVLLGACSNERDRSIPQNMTLTLSAISPSEVSLSWTPDIIDCGGWWLCVGRYKIMRNGVDIGTRTPYNSYSDRNLEPLTRYCYIIYAMSPNLYTGGSDPIGKSNQACVDTPGTAGWTIETIGIGGSSALALDSSNQPHVSYRNSSGVMLTYKNGGNWIQSLVDGGAGVDGDIDVAVDSFSADHLSYSDSINDRLIHANNTTGVWDIETVDTAVGMINAMSIDNSSSTHMIYNSASPNSGLVSYVTNTSGSWQKESIGGTEGATSTTFDADILVDTTNVAHVVFTGGSLGSSSGSVYYNNNQGGTWGSSQAVCLMCLGNSGAAMAIDSVGNVHIAYYDQFALMHAHNTSGTWQIKQLEVFRDYIGHIVSARVGLAIDGADRLHIAYRDYNDDLKYITNVSGTFRRYFIDVNGDVGGDPSITVDPVGQVSIVYTDQTNGTVKLATSP